MAYRTYERTYERCRTYGSHTRERAAGWFRSHNLRRSRNGLVWGVCKGFADWLDLPVALIRIVYLVLLITTGFFPFGLLYVLAALLMPVESLADEDWF